LSNKTRLTNTVIILLGSILLVVISYSGFNSSVKEIFVQDPHVIKKSASTEKVYDDAQSVDIEREIDVALENIERGKSTGDMTLVMNEGIMKLLEVNQLDSNNTRAIYYLGMFSLESGQLDKAEKRFEKLVSLQPENKEYENLLQQIRGQKGK